MMPAEPVHAVWDYYDGIRSGVADYHALPHYFEQECGQEEGDYLPTFILKPLDPDALEEVIEQWKIFRSWERSFHQGEVTVDTHPGLPGQDARYAELEERLRSRIAIAIPLREKPTAQFRRVAGQSPPPKGVLYEMEVIWSDAASSDERV